jgi:hypothetical protein
VDWGGDVRLAVPPHSSLSLLLLEEMELISETLAERSKRVEAQLKDLETKLEAKKLEVRSLPCPFFLSPCSLFYPPSVLTNLPSNQIVHIQTQYQQAQQTAAAGGAAVTV